MTYNVEEMSESVNGSLHDFFETRTVIDNGETLDKRDVDNGTTAKLPNESEIIKPLFCTSSNDILIEGYVIINMLDVDKTVYSSSEKSRDVVVLTRNSSEDTESSQISLTKEREYSESVNLGSENAKNQSRDYSLLSFKSDGITIPPYETSDTQKNTALQFDVGVESENNTLTRENKLITNIVRSTRKDEFNYENVTQDMPEYRECCDDEDTLTPCLNSTRGNEDIGPAVTSFDEYFSDCSRRNDCSSTCQNNRVGADNTEITGDYSDDTGCDENVTHIASTTLFEDSNNKKTGQNMKEIDECTDVNLLTHEIISTRLDEDNDHRIEECCDDDDQLKPTVSFSRLVEDKDGDITGAGECFSADNKLTPVVSSSRCDKDNGQNMTDIHECSRDCNNRKCSRSVCQTDRDNGTLTEYENDDIVYNLDHFKYEDDTNYLSITREKSTKTAEGAGTEDVTLANLKHVINRCDKDERIDFHDHRDVEDVVDESIYRNLLGKNKKTIRMARTMKESDTTSLLRRPKNCPEFLIPRADDRVHGKPCHKVKPDTPYPSQIPVLFRNVPSGMFGDSLKLPGNNNEEILPDTDTPMAAENISRLNRYSTELNFTPAITGHLNDTPRLSSVITDTGLRPLSGTMTSTSNSSGRRNPLAKGDSEVRDLERAARAHVFEGTLFATRSARCPLPPIHSDEPFSKDMGTVYRRRELTGKKNAKYLSDTKNTDKRASVNRKPTVPRVLKSSVCYQEGKFDVSIYSDGRVLSQTDPVHLNINFVRKPVRVATPTGSGAKSKAASQQKMEQVFKEPVNVVKNVKVDPQLRPAQNTKTHNHFEKKPRKGLVRMKNSPKLKFKAKAKPQQMSAEKAKSRKMSNTSENIQQKVRANIWKQSCDSLDWNIVERRAKKPPFNTHIDPEASCRHQQFFMDY